MAVPKKPINQQLDRARVAATPRTPDYFTKGTRDPLNPTGLELKPPAQGHVDAGGVVSRKSMKPGGGGRFQAFVDRLVAEGKSQSSAKAIAASAGRAKYGAAKMAKFSAQGRKRA